MDHENYIRKAVAARLNELLQLTGKTKADVARALNKDQGSVTPWFQASGHVPRHQTLVELARILDPGWGQAETVRFILSGVSPSDSKRTEWPEPKPQPVPGDRGLHERMDEIVRRIDALATRLDALAARVDQLAGKIGG